MEIIELITKFVTHPFVLLIGFVGTVLTIWSFFKKDNNNHQQQKINGNNNQQAGRDIVINDKDKS